MPKPAKTDSEFKIEKGIPVPTRGNSRRFPFADMAVGDSFLIPTKSEEEAQKEARSLWTAIKVYRKAHPLTRFSTRTLLPEGVRCWRIKDQ